MKTIDSLGDLRGKRVLVRSDFNVPLDGTTYGMHPSLAPLADLWRGGDLSWVLNVGTLLNPFPNGRTDFLANPSWRPDNLGSHSHEQEHWQSMRPGSVHPDGVFGRMADTLRYTSSVPPLVSVNGASLAMLGQIVLLICDSASMSAAIAESRPTGARINARSDRPFMRALRPAFHGRR